MNCSSICSSVFHNKPQRQVPKPCEVKLFASILERSALCQKESEGTFRLRWVKSVFLAKVAEVAVPFEWGIEFEGDLFCDKQMTPNKNLRA